jgi:hypothetical protein
VTAYLIMAVPISYLETEAKRMTALYLHDMNDANEMNMSIAVNRLEVAQANGDAEQRESARNLNVAAQRIKAEKDPKKKRALASGIWSILIGVKRAHTALLAVGAVGTVGAGGAAIYHGLHGTMLTNTDTNGDGTPDVEGIDTNGDGIVDMKFADTNYDGQYDTIDVIDAAGASDVVGNSSSIMEGMFSVVNFFLS